MTKEVWDIARPQSTLRPKHATAPCLGRAVPGLPPSRVGSLREGPVCPVCVCVCVLESCCCCSKEEEPSRMNANHRARELVLEASFIHSFIGLEKT